MSLKNKQGTDNSGCLWGELVDCGRDTYVYWTPYYAFRLYCRHVVSSKITTWFFFNLNLLHYLLLRILYREKAFRVEIDPLCESTAFLFIYSSVNGHLGRFHLLAFVNGTIMNIGVKYLFRYSLSIFWVYIYKWNFCRRVVSWLYHGISNPIHTGAHTDIKIWFRHLLF